MQWVAGECALCALLSMLGCEVSDMGVNAHRLPGVPTPVAMTVMLLIMIVMMPKPLPLVLLMPLVLLLIHRRRH